MKNNVTISQVAKEAGVSKTTISRYLNGKFENMSQDTRQRIEKKIAQLDYHPNRQAQSLKSKKSYLIGVVVSDISNMYSSLLLKGIGSILSKSNYQMIIIDGGNSLKQEQELLEKLLEQPIEGIILQPLSPETSHYDFLTQHKLPVVLVDRETAPTHWPVVTMNNIAATLEIAKYIIEKDYEKVLVVTEPIKDVLTRQLRYRTLREHLKMNGKKIQLISTAVDDTLKKDLLDAIQGPEKTAIFALNGRVLLGILKILQEEKINIPEQVGVTGFDDWNITELISPGITCIEQQSEKIGEAAGTLMLQSLEKENAEDEIILPAKIHYRHSL